MIAEFLFKNPRILFLTICTIIVAGVTSFSVMPRLEDPVLGKRVAVISTVYPGADAQQIESLVTVAIEERLANIAEIKQVRSNSRSGISNIVVELKHGITNVAPVWSLVRNRLVDVTSDLPAPCFRPELEVFPLKAFASIVAIQSNDESKDNVSILRRLAKKLRVSILKIPGTEQVDTFGDPGEELVAEVTPATLMALGLSTAAIAQQVAGNIDLQPGGRLQGSDTDLLLDLKSTPLPVKRVGETLVAYGPSGNSTRLSQLASIEKRPVEPPNNLAIIDGQPAIVLGAFVSDDQQVDRWSEQLLTVIEEFNATYPDEAYIDVLFSQTSHVNQRMKALVRNLVLGTGAVVFIVLLLMGWRSMLVVGLALPLSACMVITGMRWLSIPIHQMSVTGLIVALGLLIDNAIVIVEDIRSRIVDGESPLHSIRATLRQLAMPLFGSTLTTALAFLPIATLPGPAGEFVGTIATSVILAISASFLLAMTVIPAATALLRIDPVDRGLFSYGISIAPLRRLYESSLRFVFRFPLIGVILGLTLPGLGFWQAQQLPLQFFPPSDRQQIQIEVERPARDTIAGAKIAVDTIRQIVDKNSNILRQHWFLGRSAPTFFYNVVPRRRGTPFYAQAFVDILEGQSTAEVVRELQAAIDEQAHDSRVIVRQLEQGPPFDAPVELRLIGPDLSRLQKLGSELRLVLSQTPDVIQTRSDLEETIPKLSLEIDNVLASKAELTDAQISAQLYTTLEGAPAGTIYDGGEEIPILIKTKFDDKRKLAQLAAIQLISPRRAGSSRPSMGSMQNRPVANQISDPPPNPTLASLATFDLTSDVGAIVRVDGRRVNEVKAYIRAGVLPSLVLEDFKQRLSESDFSLPRGYTLEFGGETEQRTNAVQNLIANAIALFALMLLTLVASFRSFRCALIIAVVGGLAIGLGPLSLAVFGFPFGFMAIIGTMGLVGVSINDSIVVLAAIKSSESARDGDAQEIAKVVSGCTRHIIATTLTTMVGFTPLILGGGGFWPPLAITIAGGVGGATLLALYLVPSLYLLAYRKRATAI